MANANTLQELMDYMMNDPEWDVPKEEREAQVKAIPMMLKSM